MSQDEIIAGIRKRFIQRSDVHAIQHGDGAWHPVRKPFTDSLLKKHLDGNLTLGHYMLDTEGQVKLIAFDIDFDKKATRLDESFIEREYSPRDVWLSGDKSDPVRKMLGIELRMLAEKLAFVAEKVLNVSVAVSYSGSKGMHVYAFTGSMSAKDAREIALTVLDLTGPFERIKGRNFFKHRKSFSHSTIEIFPKQEKVRDGDGLGNLMKLALGKDQRTGHRSFFLDLAAPEDKWGKDDPLEVLSFGSIRQGEEKAVLWNGD